MSVNDRIELMVGMAKGNAHQNALRRALKELVTEFQRALAWCGGSADFNYGGKARGGWEKIVVPLLEDTEPSVKAAQGRHRQC